MNLDSPSPFVSIGGLAIGLGILVYYVLPWWWKGRKPKGGKGGGHPAEAGGKRDWRDLTPLGIGLVLGSLAAACTGGLLGWAAHGVSRANQAVGNTAVVGATGTGATGAEQGVLPALNGGAALITALVLVGVFVMWKKIPDAMRKMLAAGAWAGASLALSAGAAGIIARTVVPAINAVGDSFAGAL